MNAPLYTTDVLRLAASLPAPAVLNRVDGAAERRSTTCGSVIRTEVEVDSDGRISAISQQVHACAFGQASAALTAAMASGQNRDGIASGLEALRSWLAGQSTDPGPWTPLMPALARKSRHGAILLPLEALLAAMESAR